MKNSIFSTIIIVLSLSLLTLNRAIGDDITISGSGLSVSMVMAGDTVSVYAYQNYAGSQLDVDLPAFNLDYFLSGDCILDGTDILLGSDSSQLGSDNNTSFESATLTIPSNTAAGSYYILFAADNDNELAETDETNNIACVELMIGDSDMDCSLTHLTTIEDFDVYEHNASGAILFRAKMAIDADGCPRAYGPNDSGLDWTANAGYPGNWWGIVTDVYGDPIIQGPTDPYPGMYVSSTSLVLSGYSDYNPLRYVDSENIPYIALPSALQSLANIAKGDLAYARNITNGNVSFAYFADTGPSGKLGEASMFLADQLGINSSPRTGGTSQGIIDYVVFPQSGYGQGAHLTNQEIDSIGEVMLTLAGGFGLPDCIDAQLPTFDCANTIPLSCGVPYSGAGSTEPSIVSTYGCNTWTETGPERVHSIIPSADGTITATLSNYTGDLDVYILGSCNPDDCLGTVSSESAAYSGAIAGQTYYIVVDADDGSGSSYDIEVICPASVSTEDLTVTNATISTNQINAGAGITVNATHNYSGDQLAVDLPDFNLDYYLSTDCNLSPDDTLLGISESDIGSDNSSEDETAFLSIPANTTAGDYFILFVADNDDELLESDEGNNIACIAIIIDPLLLDCNNTIPLTCGSVYSGTSSLAVSHVQTYGCNSWTETGPERVHSVMANSNGNLTATLSNFTGDLDVYILGSCDPSDCLGTVSSFSATYDSAIAGQIYYIVVDADDGSGSAYDILVSCEDTINIDDVTISDINVSPTTIAAGDSTIVSSNQNYTGNQLQVNLPNIDLDYYLSLDCYPDSNDILLGTDESELGSDSPSAYETATLYIPSNTIPGDYYVLFVCDGDNEIIEVDETNNVICIQITITDYVSIDEVFIEDEIISYPNPTTGLLTVKWKNHDIIRVELINVLGVPVTSSQGIDNGLNEDSKNQLTSIDLGKYPNGIYFIRVADSNNNKAVLRIIKK